MFVPIVAGSDKTTVSVATGHQEYHPVYMSPGNLSNTARRAHGNGVLPVAFLPIPKSIISNFFVILYLHLRVYIASKKHRKTAKFQTFCRQMYHTCLARVFRPLKDGMTTPEVVKCPDRHFRRAVYGLGPYIADYPEQVWLSAIVQGWCPKSVTTCTTFPNAHRSIDVMHAPMTWMRLVLDDEPMKVQMSVLAYGTRVFFGRILVSVQIS